MTVRSTRRASKRAPANDRQKPTGKRTFSESTALYQALFASSPDGILLIDPQTLRAIEFNDAACRQLGYTREEFADLRVPDYEASETPAETAAHIQKLLREGQTEFDTLHRTKTGEIRHVHVWTKVFDFEGRVVFHAIVRDVTTSKLAENALRESEARYRAVSEAAGAAVITADYAGNIVNWTRSAEILFGYTAAEITGQPLTRLMPHRHRAPHVSGMKRLRSGGEPHILGKTVELEGLRKDQSEFPLEITLARWGSPEDWFVTGLIRDITERKQVEEALRHSSDLLDQTGQVAGVGGWEFDVDTQTLHWTPEVYRIHEVDPATKPTVAEAIRFYAPEARPVIATAVQAGVDAGTPFDLELPMVTGQGRRIWVRAQGTAERRGGKTIRLYGAFQDITERRRADESRRLQSAALNAAADAVVITDRSGVIEWVNPAFSQLTGYTAEEALGRNPRDLVKSGKHDSAFFKVFWETILAGRTWHGEMINRRKDGSLYSEDQAVTPIPDASGAITHFVAVKKDITERLQLEAQFLQAQKMESVGQLASGIAHDFNNLLTVINGMTDLVLAQVSSDAPMYADLREIHQAGERAALLTRQLLAFSRQQVLEPRVVNFNTTVAGMEGLLRRLLGEDIALAVVSTPSLNSVKVDPGQMEQVITNLAVNARDAMPQGGRLIIEMQNITIGGGCVRQHDGMAVPPGSYVLLAMTDSGVGMDEATRARIFEPFFTTKGPGKGTGLGLSTVYGIIKQSHGFIWVNSEVGQGTSFKIYLPQVTEAAGAAGPGPAVGSGLGTESILLVEDNAGLRRLATRLLERAGYTVLGAPSAEEALDLLERHGEPVHLLLSDVVLPGMSGRHLAERLAQTHPAMKVLFMSGYTSDTIVRHGVLDAHVPFLNKPFTAAVLLGKVREVLNSQA